MKSLKWMVALPALIGLVACGGGGVGPEGAQPFGGSNGSTTGTPTLSVSASSATVSASTPSTVTAVLRDGQGKPAAGQLVEFATTGAQVTLSATTGVTDAAGATSVTVSAAAATGATQVTASAKLGTVALQQSTVLSVAAGATGVPTLGLALSSATISSASPAVVTATLLDANGQPVAGRVISFTTQRKLGSLSLGTALTNASGQAVVALAPVSSTAVGADEVVASVTLAGSDLQAAQGFQLQASQVTLTAFSSSVGSGTLSAYGQAALKVTVSGASAGSPVNVVLASSCLTAGKATVSPASFTATTAETSVQYKDNGCGALQGTDKLQATISGSSAAPLLLDIAVSSPTVSSLSFVEALPGVIFLKGSGFGEVSNVSFELRDFAGNPLPNQDIELSLVSAAGGVTIEGGTGPVTQRTNGQGRVTVRINSGTVPTPVRVLATVASPRIQTVSSALSVGVGLPSQQNFSLAQATANIEGFNLDGTANTYTIIASDRSGNPVPAGTSINFVTESGQVEAIRQTQLVQGLSRTSANYISASPRPADGRFTVTAYALGEESFLDVNGNNVYDAGEPFQDLGDIFRDRNFDGVFDSANDEVISLGITGTVACATPASPLLEGGVSIPSIVGTCDGRWGRTYVRRSTETVLSTSGSDLLWSRGTEPAITGGSVLLTTGPGLATTEFKRVGGSSITKAGTFGTLVFIVRDQNPVRLNPVAAGSIVSLSATDGLTVTLLAGSPVANTTEATSAALRYEFNAQTATGSVTVTVRSPSGVGTAFVLSLTK